MVYQEVRNNLFTGKEPFKVCTVNLVGAMGAGIAKEFRFRHPDLYYHYKKLCRKKKFKIGSIVVYNHPHATYRSILLPTKRFWKDNSRLLDVELSIQALAKYVSKLPGIEIAMSPPGCGLGGLNYESDVKPLIEKHMGPLDCTVNMYVYR